MTGAVLWFRRDLRLRDHPAVQAASEAGPVTALFVLDPALLRSAGAPRVAFLLRSLRALDADLRTFGGGLVVRTGRPEVVVPAVVAEVDARSVHVSDDFGPYGRTRDARVEQALGPVPVLRTGSPYAVAPGRVRSASGEQYKVFTAFYRAWCAHGWRAPAASDAAQVEWRVVDSETVPDEPELPPELALPNAGEAAAREAWLRYRAHALSSYAEVRDRPDLDGTSRLSVYLKYGALHPRTLLAELGPDDEVFRKELAWREFYADVLHTHPDSARRNLHQAFDALVHDEGSDAEVAFIAWCEGRTGFPIVDAGMRQLLAEGWMHNRVRMIVASFLVKDLHLPWWRGARHFMRHLVDGDMASNAHGWQWTAGTGTDAAPFFRVFNPIRQGVKFDPEGNYVRRWVPELRGLSGAAAHEPWKAAAGLPVGYPAPIVDHGIERAEALRRYEAVKAAVRTPSQ